MQIEPVLGKLEWDLKDSGIWFSSTWKDNSELRLRNAGNFNDQFDIKYPSGKLSSYCMDDLHLQFESKWVQIPVIENQASLIITTKSQITSGITSSSINLIQGANDITYSLEHNKILEINLPIENSNNKTLIISDVELTIILKLNEGGVTFIKPNNSNHKGLGTTWKIPLPAGNNKINIISEDENLINLIVGDEKITEKSTKRREMDRFG